MDVDEDRSDLSSVSDSVLLDEVEPHDWEEWEKKVITDHKQYYLDVITHAKEAIELITQIYHDGPIDAETDMFNEDKPMIPNSDLGALVYESGSAAYQRSAAYQAVARKNSKK